MANPIFQAPFTQGYREVTGESLNAGLADPWFSSQDGITAGLAAGGQAGAYALSARVSRVTSANAGDGVRLPKSQPGMVRYIWNGSGNSIAIFPAPGESINGGAANASATLANARLANLVCFTSGAWYGAVALS